MSALPPIADIALHRSECPLCAKSGHSALRQKSLLFDHVVSLSEPRGRYGEPEGLSSC